MKDKVSGFIFAWVIIAFVVIGVVRHERHGRAQSSTQGSTGMPAPIPSGAGAPGTYFTCNAAFTYLQFVNTTNYFTYYCDGTTWNQEKSYLSGTTGTITGTLLAVGGTDSGTVSVTGATVGMPCGGVTATDGTNPSTSVTLSCRVASAGVVTVELTAAAIGTPASKAYNVRLWP